MDETPPAPAPAPLPATARRLRDLHELLAHMQELHAQLEYLRLMLKLGAGPR